ncbi:MAG: hypothetical protein PHC34_13590, partial [Candidatus Gastranaerophilales bacterium]|nr:hypothetical protein [Candidatus Gastranaerophilales bacterium]
IPNNYFAVMSAINRGLPIYKVDSNCNISQNFIELAQSIEGKSSEQLKSPVNGVKNLNSSFNLSLISSFIKNIFKIKK